MIEKTAPSSQKEEKLKIKSKKKASRVGAGRESFSAALDATLAFDFQGGIEELMNELKEQERRFLDAQTLYELSRYKALVQKILKLLLDEGFKTETLRRHRKDRADFIIVQEINTRLLDMTNAITRNNPAFNLLKTVEEIRGLLLDLQF